MNYDFSKNISFKNYIKTKEKDIARLTSGGIQETEVFRKFYAALISYLHANSFQDFKALLISKEDLCDLPDDYYKDLEKVLNSEEGSFSNLIQLDSTLSVINSSRECHNYKNSNDAQNFYRSLSEKFIVFLLQPKQLINYFVDGIVFGESIFYTPEDLKKYQERKTVDKLGELFEEYRVHLKNRSTYNKFFITKSHLKSLKIDLENELSDKDFIKKYKHLLQNTPEDRFRDDLKTFLKNRLKAIITVGEYLLENLQRLDICIVDESGNEFYLIEVKWVGVSIHKDGKKIGTSYNEKNINPDAVKQSVRYIRQLDTENINIKRAYLAVFDARREDAFDTLKEFDESIFDEIDKKYYKKFRKIDDFRVINIHPSS